MLHQITTSAMAQMDAIIASPAKSPLESAHKAHAIANLVISHHLALSATYNITGGWFA